MITSLKVALNNLALHIERDQTHIHMIMIINIQHCKTKQENSMISNYSKYPEKPRKNVDKLNW